jgi:predicted HicB family RNase H-like nuclease
MRSKGNKGANAAVRRHAPEDEEMSKNTYPLKLPASVKKAAAELAATDGVSLNQPIR